MISTRAAGGGCGTSRNAFSGCFVVGGPGSDELQPTTKSTTPSILMVSDRSTTQTSSDDRGGMVACGTRAPADKPYFARG
jgi:hypothetical protein